VSRRSLMLPAAAGSVLATMFALAQVFLDQRWLLPSVLAVCVAFGVGWVSRRLDVPGVLSPALSLLALVALLGIVFHPSTTAFGLPTAATLRAIGESIVQARRDIHDLSAPADATDALTLLSTAGVYVIAVFVEVLVFRLRRPVAAGLPLLALFLVPTAMAPKGAALAFAVAAVGYLGLLLAEGRDRARSWGRRLSGIDVLDDVADVSHVARVGRRIGTAAIGLALCVPVALPSVGDGIFTGGGGVFGNKGDGGRTVTEINPIVRIQAQLLDKHITELFTVRTDSPEYLRLTPLNDFDGSSWVFEKLEVGSDHKVGSSRPVRTPKELGAVTTETARYEMHVGALAVHWLPLPYVPSVVDISGDWRWEDVGLAVYSTRQTSQDKTFTVTSRLPHPTADQLRAPGTIPDSIKRFLTVPKQTPPLALEVMHTITDGKATPYDKAFALNEYFFSKGGFEYTLDVPGGNSKDALTAFLENKKGYCEQFAAAMAYLSRLAHIPARVVVGFTPGHRRNDGTYVVTNQDAHAWPELYFPGTGWVRFEPTPRTGYVVRPPYTQDTPNVNDPSTPSDGTPGVTPTPSASPRPNPNQRPLPEDQPELGAPPDAAAGGRRGNGGVPVLPLLLTLALCAAVTPSVVAAFVRRHRRRAASDHVGRIHVAWAELADAAEDAGWAMRAADSPRAAGRRLVADGSLAGPAADEVSRLALAEERARYARTAPPVDGLAASVVTVRRALRTSLPRAARVRSVVFPASSLRRINRAVRDAGDWADRKRTAFWRRAGEIVRRRPRTASA
jgi:transglutaminase-like putative cysteine protease